MNTFCEHVIGTIRRQCTDHVLPFTENHLRCILKQWMSHYNTGRPHMSLEPGIPHAPPGVIVPLSGYRHQLPGNCCVVIEPILGGLHHEYSLKKAA